MGSLSERMTSGRTGQKHNRTLGVLVVMQRITPDLVVCCLAVSVAWESAWLCRQLCSGSLTSVIQAGVSSEGLAGEGSAANLMWLLADSVPRGLY